MRIFKLGVFSTMLSFAIILTSCTSEENALSTEAPSAELLKSFKVKRDLNGSYFLDFDLKSDAKVDKIYDEVSNTNQIYLYSSNNSSKRKVTEEVSITNSQLKIGFVDTNTDKTPTITITDDNIALAKGNNDALQGYEVTSNEDGTFQLDFSVADGVNVDFTYNNNLEAYEIHLESGKGDNSSYSRTFEKTEGQALKVDFINHVNTSSSKYANKEPVRRPRVVLDGVD